MSNPNNSDQRMELLTAGYTLSGLFLGTSLADMLIFNDSLAEVSPKVAFGLLFGGLTEWYRRRSSPNITVMPKPESVSDADLWTHQATHSERAAGAALMGVYGREVAEDEALIQRALKNELTEGEVTALDARRPIGEEERFGEDGTYGWSK